MSDDFKIFSEQEFANERIVIDDCNFIKCTFTDCELVYSGNDKIGMQSCTLNNCKWLFDGKAANTLSFLSALYHNFGDDGKTLVEQIYTDIKKGTFVKKAVIMN